MNFDKLHRMQQYAEADICRRRILLNYFGENMEHNCGNCDVCKNPPEHFDGTILVQKALSAIARADEQISTRLLVDVLRGNYTPEIIKKQFDKLKTFGAGRKSQHAIGRISCYKCCNWDTLKSLIMKTTI